MFLMGANPIFRTNPEVFQTVLLPRADIVGDELVQAIVGMA